LTAPSILSVISLSICSGEAPGLMVVTATVGTSTFGSRSTPRPKNEYPPTTVSDSTSIVAKTGRRTQSSASARMFSLLLRRSVRPRRHRGAGGSRGPFGFDADGRAVDQLRDVRDDHGCAGLQACEDP